LIYSQSTGLPITLPCFCRLQADEDFRIIEINEAGSVAIHTWDPQLPLHSVCQELLRAQSLMFEIVIRLTLLSPQRTT
jgi:hypothetical protein